MVTAATGAMSSTPVRTASSRKTAKVTGCAARAWSATSGERREVVLAQIVPTMSCVRPVRCVAERYRQSNV